MNKLYRSTARFIREEDAPTMVEYGLMLACIAFLVVFAGHLLGQVTNQIFQGASIVASVR